MKKILNYIANGKGTGALWLFLFSLIMTVYAVTTLNNILPQGIPYVQKFADDILPLKVENQKLVVPENTIMQHIYNFGDEEYRVVVDSTKDLLVEEEYKPGVYLTRSYIYTIKENDVRRQAWKTDFNLPKQDYTPMLQTFVKWVIGFASIIGPFVYFLCFFVAVLFYAFCSGFSCALNKTELDFKTKMRLNVLLFIAVYILSTLCSHINIDFSMLGFFLLMIASQILSVKKVAENQKTEKEVNAKEKQTKKKKTKA